MIRLILILAVGIAGWLIYKLYLKQLLSQGRQGKIKLVLIVLGLLLVILALTGRASIVFAIIGAAMTQIMRIMPLLIRFFPMLQQFRGQSKVFRNQTNQSSQVRSNLLLMTLDHDSGHIDGEITGGQFSGRTLGELSLDELRSLLSECQQQDPEGVRLVQAYVSRVHGDQQWTNNSEREQQSGSADESSAARPSVSEAGEILAIDPNAPKAEIIAAHRKLMGKVHPDKGGSNYLAAKINAAKEVLIDHSKGSDV